MSMLVCQPPSSEMAVQTPCCGSLSTRIPLELRPQPHVRSETGVTIGQVLYTVVELVRKHRTCPFTEPCKHNHDGCVNVRPSFEGRIVVGDEDIAVKHLREEQGKDAARMARMRYSVDVKRRCFKAGTPIRPSGWSTSYWLAWQMGEGVASVAMNVADARTVHGGTLNEALPHLLL